MIESFGIKEVTVAGDEAAICAEEMRTLGFTRIRGVGDALTLATAREKLDRIYADQVSAARGAAELRRINDENVARCPLAFDPFFLELARHPRVLAVVGAMLGDYFILQQQNGLLNPSDGENYQTRWHRDLPYQHFVVSRPLAVNALWCIEPFDETTGATRVLQGTHKTEKFPSEAFVLAHEATADANPGDVLVLDSMIFHRAGNNRSGRVRRALNNVYALPFLKQQINLPRFLPESMASDPFLRRFLGFDSDPADSIDDWRGRRLGRVAG